MEATFDEVVEACLRPVIMQHAPPPKRKGKRQR